MLLSDLAISIFKATLQNQGSSTNINGHSAKKGYMISIKDCLVVDEKKFNTKHVIKVLKNNKEMLKQGFYLGTWVNDGKVYIDISEREKLITQAIKKGIERKQLGIFNLNNFETIMLG